jgi:hypothetical protein
LGYSSAYAYNVTDWTNQCKVANNATFTATFAYGSAALFNGVKVPSADRNGQSSGACLGVSSGWGPANAVQFTQPVRLPAGNYQLIYDVYNGNANATTLISNLTGFHNSTTTWYDATTNYPALSWITSSASASFTQLFQGEVSVGASCSSGSSGVGPKCFIDHVRLFTNLDLEQAENFYWQAAKDSALAALNRYPNLTSGALYDKLQAALQQTFNTIETCAEAIKTLQEATAEFLAGAPLGLIGIDDKKNTPDTPNYVYNLQGQRLSSQKYTRAEALQILGNGLYILGNEKLFISSN